MKEFWDKYKVWIIAALILIAAGGGVLFYFSILKKGQAQGVSEAIATVANPANDEPYTSVERVQIGQLTQRIENEFSGIGWSVFWSDYSPLTDLSTASSRIQVGVCNQYKQDRPTTDLITDISSLKSLNYDFSLMRDTLTAQLKNVLNQTSPQPDQSNIT